MRLGSLRVLFLSVTLTGGALAQDPVLPGERRIALVIGNGAYPDAPLKNPTHDAEDMTEALRRCGFEVTRLENGNREQMFAAIRAFGQKIAGGGVGLFYFAGHGLQVKGRNYLIPIGADIRMEDEVAVQALDADSILAKMESARNRLNILVLDACRNNPFGRSFRSSQQGLAQMDAPVGSFIAFATAPGRTAADGTGRNGLFTRSLLEQLQRPGLKIEEVFKSARIAVQRDSGGIQVPWDSSSLMGDFVFLPLAKTEGQLVAPAPVPPPMAFVAPTPAPTVVAPLHPTKEAPISPFPGQIWMDATSGLEFCWVPPGTFTMGSHPAEELRSREEGPQHSVSFAQGFWMGRFEVTQGQFQSLLGNNPAHFKQVGVLAPVEQVSWQDAHLFLQKLNDRAGKMRYRLPSEAEWEYACRAGNPANRYGNAFEVAWFKLNSGKLSNPLPGITWGSGYTPHPVGLKAPNAWGLFDMLGNVQEWCEDLFHKNYEGAPANGSPWLLGGEASKRVVRGGDWDHYLTPVRAASRAWEKADTRNRCLGFRVVAAPRIAGN